MPGIPMPGILMPGFSGICPGALVSVLRGRRGAFLKCDIVKLGNLDHLEGESRQDQVQITELMP